MSTEIAAPASDQGAPETKKSMLAWFGSHGDRVIQYVMLAILVVGVLLLSLASPIFRSPENLLNILSASAMIGVVTVGMLIMIITGGFDLSVGAVGAASGCLAAVVSMEHGLGPAIACAIVLAVVIGVANGFLIGVIGMNPFVVTLGMASLVTGILFTMTGAVPIYGLPDEWLYVGFTKVAGVTMPVLVWIGVLIVAWWLLRQTKFGTYVYAVGSSAPAADRAGIPVRLVYMLVYAMGSLCAGIAGVLLVGLSKAGTPAAGSTWALTAIAAVVIGGTALRGGSGSVKSAVVGTLILGVMSNAFTIFGLSPFLTPAVTGAVILVAVAFETYARKKAR